MGEREEIEQAYKISADSLKMATEQISSDEMKQAKEQGLISNDELIEFVQNKRQQEMKSARASTQDSSSHKHQH